MGNNEFQELCNGINFLKASLNEKENNISEEVLNFSATIKVQEKNVDVNHVFFAMAKIIRYFSWMNIQNIDKAFSDKNNSTEDFRSRYKVLREMFLKSLTVFDEIICLTKNGLINGAMQRWRTLYEYSILMKFIEQNGEEVAESYMKGVINSLNDGMSAKTNYAWASVAPQFSQVKQIPFKKIKDTLNGNKVFDFTYKLSSQSIHGSPIGSYSDFALSSYEEIDTDSNNFNEDIGMVMTHTLGVFVDILITCTKLYCSDKIYEFDNVLNNLCEIWSKLYYQKNTGNLI